MSKTARSRKKLPPRTHAGSGWIRRGRGVARHGPYPLRTLKLDRAFVTDVTERSDHAAIAAAIITLAHTLGLNVVCEGVETAEQLAFMRAHGCDEAQGWLVSPPVAAEEIASLLRAQRRRKTAGKELRLPLAG